MELRRARTSEHTPGTESVRVDGDESAILVAPKEQSSQARRPHARDPTPGALHDAPACKRGRPACQRTTLSAA